MNLRSLIPFINRNNKIHFRLVAKEDSELMQLLSGLLSPFVGEDFMSGYWTTIGHTIYYPSQHSAPEDHDTIAHELEHVRQFMFWGFLFPLLYVCALPVLFNPFRFWWELVAYKISIDRGFPKDRVIELLGGSAYGWCMPRFIVKFFL